MHKILHLDFKGAPLKIPYLKEVLRAAKSWGCTGVLVEWEDTFPYWGDLEDIGSIRGCGGDEMYTEEEVREISRIIKDFGLDLIPLVQTIGHMEFVLKHSAFKELREEPSTPADLCPSRPESLALVKAMLEQVLILQPDTAYFHIGADEVWHTAVCQECKTRAMASEHGVASLYLEHIREIALFLKSVNRNIVVMMWDDMLRSMNADTLNYYKMGEIVQPVVWNYNVKEHFKIETRIWNTYEQVFRTIWAASAFKGANGSCKIVSPVERYVSNQVAWMDEIHDNVHNLVVDGIIFTGWSRYDHYATLCEMMPVSMPSLAYCVKYWDGCTKKPDYVVSNGLEDMVWPGELLAISINHKFLPLKEQTNNFIHGDMVSTWMNPWQLKHAYTSPAQLGYIMGTAQILIDTLKGLKGELYHSLLIVTGKRSATEWIGTNLTPLLLRIEEIQKTAALRITDGASVKPN